MSKKTKVIISITVFVIAILFINFTYFNNFLFIFGCYTKGIAPNGSTNAQPVPLKSKYTYEQIYNLVKDNSNYQIDYRNGYVLYIKRTIDDLFITFTVNNDPQLGTTFNFSLMDNPRQKMLDFGASCQTPNWQIRNRVNNFITGMNLPKDLERELLNSYRIYISIPHNGYSFTM
jgi:hypothetical protein